MGSEAIRILRTNQQFTSPDRELKRMLVKGAGTGDGKSTVAANLAAAWAQSGARVLLVSCDLRRPIIHRIFGISNTPGLTGYLAGRASIEEVIHPPSVPGLALIASGPVPPNPAVLLQSTAMGQFLRAVREDYDAVISDGAPVMAVTDAAVGASQTDCIIFVVEAGQTPREAAIHAKELLEQAKANILGVFVF